MAEQNCFEVNVCSAGFVPAAAALPVAVSGKTTDAASTTTAIPCRIGTSSDVEDSPLRSVADIVPLAAATFKGVPLVAASGLLPCGFRSAPRLQRWGVG